MKFEPEIHHRRSIRLKGYDYRRPGAYFVTMCVQGRECLFGEIRDGEMVPNEAGRMVRRIWRDLPGHYPGLDIDCHMVMPNHFHGIVWIVGAGPRACPGSPTGPRACPGMNNHHGEDRIQIEGHPQGGAPTGPKLSLPDVVHRFKSLTTARYRHGVVENDWTPFLGRLWQRNYYERIIRDEAELFAVRQYIRENLVKWAVDAENPMNQS